KSESVSGKNWTRYPMGTSVLLFLVYQNVVDRFAVGSYAALGDGSDLTIAGDFPFFDDELFPLLVSDALDGAVVDELYRHCLSGNSAIAGFSSWVFLSIILRCVCKRG